MIRAALSDARPLEQRLAEAEATIAALLTREIDAVVDTRSQTPVLLSIAQKALRASEERYRRIVETADEGISIVDSNGIITFVNRQVATMLGYTVDELIGTSMYRCIPAGDTAHAALRLQHSELGISEEHEVTYLRKDGTELWVMLRTTPIHDADGHHMGSLGMITDRTHHRAAEEALRKSEAQYRQIVEATTDGIIKTDQTLTIVFVNRQLAEMLGYEPAEMIGRSLYSIIGSGGKEIAEESLKNRQLGLHGMVDTTYRHKDGTEVSVNIAGSALSDGDGTFTGALGIVRNVTAQKKLQAQLMVSDRMASVGMLAAGVAHEINNPLAAVIANLDFIVESMSATPGHPSPSAPVRDASWILDDIRSPLDEARDAAQRVRFIVRDLKVFSRSPDNERRHPVDVQPILESSLRMAWNEIRHRARVVTQFDSVPSIDANEARLGQVFLNLLVNAAQALPEGHADRNEVRVSTRVEGDRVVIEVGDTGPGIPPDVLPRIFDAFFTTKAVGVGTGLGLAISHRIVTDMGGTLTVQSTPALGTVFRVALPIASMNPEAPPTDAPPATVHGRRGRILLVDDEPTIVRVAQRILATEHEVVATVSAREALALCAGGQRFDLILCDLMMPDMTGMDLHRELARVAPEQAHRMIFLTGGAFTPQARTFLSDPPKEYIEKPFDAGNLRAIVHRHLRSTAPDTAPPSAPL
ncbi:MAG: PAS domain S-box protein [Gemmatimonadaceae bacterium]